jgi:hypothetical protein
MTTPVASATVTIFNRIKSGSNGWGMEAGNVSRDEIVPQVIQLRLLACWKQSSSAGRMRLWLRMDERAT